MEWLRGHYEEMCGQSNSSLGYLLEQCLEIRDHCPHEGDSLQLSESRV